KLSDFRLVNRNGKIAMKLEDFVVTGHPEMGLVQVYEAVLNASGFNLKPIGGFTVDGLISGICLYRSQLDRHHYAFVVSTEGRVQQWRLSHTPDDTLNAHLLREFFSGFGASYCLADDIHSRVYIVEEDNSVWAFNAAPEAEAIRGMVDTMKPFGRLAGGFKGLALYQDGNGGGYFIISDEDSQTFHFYTRRQHYYMGGFQLALDDGLLGKFEGISAFSGRLGRDYPGGILLITDDESSKYQLVSWQTIAEEMDLTASTNVSSLTKEQPAVVMPVAETHPVEIFGDAADDPAIWVHPDDPMKSLIIGTQKRSGLYVYNLQGEVVQFLPDGRLNNVDLRSGFMLGGKSITIVAATNRSDNSVTLYKLSAENPRLTKAAPPIPSGFEEPYGLCMYHEQITNTYYVIATDTRGNVNQWQLRTTDGQITADLQRSFDVGSQAEGCVTDDELGHLYISEEEEALWKYSASPAGGNARAEVDGVDSPEIEADLEGISIYYGDNGTGYLIVSNQGADNYALYRREGDNEFLGMFHIIANTSNGVDGASESDGLDITNQTLGNNYPQGLMVVQDGRNRMPTDKQNFKLISWKDIMTAMELQ
ncbi:MAG: phytase, partial [Pseudomonadota bacterium]